MRIVGRLLRLLAGGFVALVAIVLVFALATQTPWFKSWLRQLAVRQANRVLNGELSIGHLDGNLFSGVTLDRVTVTMGGERVIDLDSVVVRYDIREMIAKGVSIARLEVRHPVVTLIHGDDGWNLGHMIRPRNEPDKPGGKRRPLVFQRIDIVDGAVAVGGQVPSGAFRMPHHFDQLDASLTLSWQPGHWTFDLDRVAFQASDPTLAMKELSGSIVIDDGYFGLQRLAVHTADSNVSVDGTIARHVEDPNVDLAVVADTLVLPELAPLVP